MGSRLAGEVSLSPLRLAAPMLYPVGSGYVERYWLPVLGPSATWALRRLGPLAASATALDPVRVRLGDLAAELGLGAATGSTARVEAALERLLRFHVAASPAPDALLVAPSVPPIRPGSLVRLPPHLQEAHPRA